MYLQAKASPARAGHRAYRAPGLAFPQYTAFRHTLRSAETASVLTQPVQTVQEANATPALKPEDAQTVVDKVLELIKDSGAYLTAYSKL